ncbi:amidohydrolase [uncultured Paludibaculum sp.]|uniref:amidohydrolase n=1 Tax=uncultured Paludibaculum sp. TaxID=1765020 RepID=UPI002AAAC719|nr:amidohydrolase [uncultured Paludibaculum sp.]
MIAQTIIRNASIATLGAGNIPASAVAIHDGRFVAVGIDQDVEPYRGPDTLVIDAHGRTLIPGLNDSHLHLIRGGLNYNMELRWDGVPSLADALRMLRDQARRTPAPQWVRVVGGWNEFQFAERRLPTLEEINEAAPDTPVFVLHLYDRALLNAAALRAVGYTKDTPAPPGTEIQHDHRGQPTGLLIARPNASILYATLAKGPKLSYDDQVNSTRQFMRELNRLGLTSAIDAGGGFQNYPDDYAVIEDLRKQGQLTIRIAYNLFTQKPKQELEDFTRWTGITRPGEGDHFYRMNGAGEMLVFSAADFEDFLEPRPDLAASMETELKAVVRHLAEHRWPFRLHATYDESISRFLNVFEEVNREIPFNGLHWFFDHAETISDKNIDRVAALGGGIAVQHRMAFQGEYFTARYGQQAAERTPPIKRMLQMGLPVGAGTDATRVASYNPFVSLYWMVTGRTVGGLALYPESNRLDRTTALRLYTEGSSWFSTEQDQKGSIETGKLADVALLSADYFSIPDAEIRDLESVLTIVGGKVVYASAEFQHLDPAPLPVSPDWSPVKVYGGYHAPHAAAVQSQRVHAHCSHAGHGHGWQSWPDGLFCNCWAF